MSTELSSLIRSFVEDCREHLDSIEASLMDMEAAGEHQDPELVNTVFRLAHSIKGGAGMLGLDNIKTLAHKLENVLHMVRSNELVPTHAVVDVLLKGFDRLTFLVDNINESETLSIDTQVKQLLALAQQAGAEADARPVTEQFEVGKSGIFNVDAQSLEQVRKGGNELYLLEFDMIHDIHGKGRMPFEVLKTLMDTGRIVDCKVDFAAVGDLDDFGNSIPFYVLFASILEPKYVGGLVKLPDERVRHIDKAESAITVTASLAPETPFGALILTVADGVGHVTLPREITPLVLKDLRELLLAGLEHCSKVVVDWSELSHCDIFFFQMLLSARNSYAKRSKELVAAGLLPAELNKSCQTQGLGLEGSANCMLALN